MALAQIGTLVLVSTTLFRGYANISLNIYDCRVYFQDNERIVIECGRTEISYGSQNYIGEHVKPPQPWPW
jgi:hypothetical protein